MAELTSNTCKIVSSVLHLAQQATLGCCQLFTVIITREQMPIGIGRHRES